MSDVRPLHFGKILPPPYAGVEAHVDLLLRALAPEVKGTLLACGEPSDTFDRASEFPYRLIVERLIGRVASTLIAPGMVGAVRDEISSGRCNLLHLHAPNPVGDLSGIAAAGDAPIVLTWHSDIVRQRALLRLYRPVQRRIIDRADRIVVFTPAHYSSSTQLRQAGVEAKLHVIPMGLDFSRLDPSYADETMTARLDSFADQRPLLLTVGRHVYYKGYEYLLAAMAQLRSDSVLAMVGVGPERENLRRLTAELGVTNRVLFLGEVGPAELTAAILRCDVFTLPSIEPSEAFGIASAEAMACGKPTVVCQLNNGVNFLNRDGVTGLTVAPRDTEALADAIDLLIRDSAMRARMGVEAAAWVRSHFSLEAMRAGTIDLYRALS